MSSYRFLKGVIVGVVVIVLFVACAHGDDGVPAGKTFQEHVLTLDSDAADEVSPRVPAENIPGGRGLLELLMERDTLTDNWFGAGEALADRGIWVGLGLTQIYQLQLNSTKGLQTHRHAGRYTGRYDLEAEFDLETLLGLCGASVYAWAEGGWSEGLGASSVGSWQDVNSDAYLGDQAIQLSVLYYQQNMLNDRVRVRLGKLDSSANSFYVRGHDVGANINAYAQDENRQFLNSAFMFDSTIPYPWYSLGVSAMALPTDWFYVYGAIVDDDPSDYGNSNTFQTAFGGPAYFFTNVETGLILDLPQSNGSGTLPGTYRFGMWHQNRPKEDVHGGDKRDDIGFYVSLDQMVFKERDDAEDVQGLGAFARFGLADGDVNPFSSSWSAGAQYQGLIPKRDQDIIGFAVSQVAFGDYAEASKRHETVYESYYRVQVTPWWHVTPSVQVVTNPGGEAVGDAVVVGIRTRLTF